MLSNTLAVSEIQRFFETALSAALSAGELLLSRVNSELNTKYKGRVNLVTSADQDAEQLIIDIIRNSFPAHQILAEERPPVATASEYRWIIDPLDGTTNYVHGLPFYAVSIALEWRGRIIVGVVNVPALHEVFTAIHGQGAYLNKKSILVSTTTQLNNALLATGFPYEQETHFHLNFELFKAFYQKCQGIRRAGSAAIDLCYVACGRFDGFWEYALNPWDVAAGSLIVTEASGKVTNIDRTPFRVDARQILATNGRIMDEMYGIFEQFSLPGRQI